MSLPESASCSHAPLPSKPVPKSEPPIPSKPSNNGSDCPTVPKKCNETKNVGKVKKIVSQFNEQEIMDGGGDRGEMKSVKKEANDEVPGQGENVTISVREEGGRSAPDGKEVQGEVQMDSGVGAEVQQDLEITYHPHCEKDCSCLCHLERPGMRLVWVPVEGEDDVINGSRDEEEKATEQSEAEGGSGTEEEMEEEEEEEELEEEEKEESGSSGVEEGPQLGKAERAKEDLIYDTTLEEVKLPLVKANPAPEMKPTSCEEQNALHRSSPPISAGNRVLLPSPRLPHRLPPQSTGPKSLPSTQQPRDIVEDGGSDRERGDTVEEELGPKNLSRGVSVNLKTQLQDGPFYQTYHDTVIHKEIKVQTLCRNISKTIVDYQMDWGVRMGDSTQSTLWQDIPSVMDSGILQSLSPAQLQHQETMFEVLTSEASYLRSLRVLTDHFMESRDLQDTLIVREKKTLFSNILRVREVSERFLTDLEERMEKSVLISDICDIIYYHAQHNFSAYIDYLRNQIYQGQTYSNLMQKNAKFATVISRLQESPQCQRLPLMSFLLLPFQRITRIKLLIENILKRTQEGTKEEENASKALVAVSKIIEECNTEVGKMKQMEELIHIAKTLEFDKLKAIPIISQNRFMEKRGELQEMAKGGSVFNIRSKFTPVFLILFNDLLILTSKKSSERYVVIDRAHRSLVQVKVFDKASPGPGFNNCFFLILLENHQGRISERLLKAPTESDMHRWLAAFPDPNDPKRDVEEVVYYDWDCPQVQCAEPYIAQQADELTLEPAEIVNVIRKGNDGWYEGIRLSDRQKGWFPVGNVLQITNEHVRMRNLRERYRVIQAANALYLGPKSSAVWVCKVGYLGYRSVFVFSRRSVVVASQNYLCAGCGTQVEAKYLKRLRYCVYLGRYFCDCCHSDAESVIPGHVLEKWDFGRYPVCNFSRRLLESIWYQPLFSLAWVGKNLRSRARDLARFMELQEQLLAIKKLLTVCRLSDSVLQELAHLPGHLTQEPVLLSMDDLQRIKRGQLVPQARALLRTAIAHVDNCQICLARGFICEFCKKEHVLFPFQTMNCKRCEDCKSCFHMECFREEKCPKCRRIQNRRTGTDSELNYSVEFSGMVF